MVVLKFLENFSRFSRSSSHQLIEHFEIKGAPYPHQMVDVGGENPVNFCSPCGGLGFRVLFAPHMFGTVESLTSHIALARLAQLRERSWLDGARPSLRSVHYHLNQTG